MGMGFNFLGNADPDRGKPRLPGVRIGADFFVFWIWGGVGLVMRMGGERRFAPLLRIAAAQEGLNGGILLHGRMESVQKSVKIY